tara:strand:- start:1408 stop:1746 length:339 start_codon:yes stop_codon:yes gene_type:complete
MAKMYGNVQVNPNSGGSRPDLKGSIRVGGFSGNNADDKNRECAMFIKNLVSEFKEENETWISVALWKRKDESTGDSYFSLCLEDNSFKANGAKANGKASSHKVEEEEDPFAL